MHRAFRSPIFSALQTATRKRLYSGAAQTPGSGNSAQGPAGQSASTGQNGTNDTLSKSQNALENEAKIRAEFVQIKKSIQPSQSVNELRDLVKVHEIMAIYRKYRTETASVNASVNASEPIHAILTTLRLRSKVLKPVISTVRRQIMSSQNIILTEYLNEIADDLISGKCYASHFALCYLLTAFSTIEEGAVSAAYNEKDDQTSSQAASGQAAAVWKRLSKGASEAGTEKTDLAKKLNDPRVVTAVLRFSDPAVLKLEEVVALYKETTEKHGKHMLADEALAMGYMKFGEFGRAVEVYAQICGDYDIGKWEGSIVRLHNQILTQCPDLEISNVFFDTAVSEESFIKLHPSAAAHYIPHFYTATGDVEKTVVQYERAMHRLATQAAKNNAGSDMRNCINLVSEVLKCVVHKHYVLLGATIEARQHLTRIIEAAHRHPLVLNTTLSFVSKTWPDSDYIGELHREYFGNTSELGFDSLRVLLNSTQFISSQLCSVEQVGQWWFRLISLKSPQLFDWLSLAKACDNTERAHFYVEQITALDPKNLSINYDAMPFVKAALSANGQHENTEGCGDQITGTVIESELSVRA